MRANHAVRGALAVGAVAFFATACGGSSSPSAGTTPSTGSTSPASDTTTSASSGGGSDSGSSFCGFAKEAEKLGSQESSSAIADADPTQLSKYFQQAEQTLQKATNDAPAAIKSQFVILSGAESKILDALKAAHFDFTKLNTSAVTAAESPAVTKASEQIDTYLQDNCGIKVQTSTSP